MPKLIRITFATITPESAEQGDAADRGWVDENGFDAELDDIDRLDTDVTVVDKAIDYIEAERFAGSLEPSDSECCPGHTWYTSYGDQETSGNYTNHSFHLDGFTDAEELAIYKRLT